MIEFDLRTVFLTDGLVAAIATASMVMIALSRATYGGFWQWTAGTFALNAGLILVGLRGSIPHFVSVIIGNGAILGAIVLVYDGLAVFGGNRPKRPLYLIPFAAWLLPFLYFTYVRPSFNARVEIISIVSLGVAVAVLVRYWSRAYRRYGPNWILPIGTMIQIIMAVVRLVYTFTAPPEYFAVESTTSVQALILAGSFAAGFFVVIGLITLNYQRTERDLATSQDELGALRGILPICASCKRIRDDKGYWNAVESYLHEHADLSFSHSLCPDCIAKLYPDIQLGPR